jgi:hypothetical protein
MTDQAPNTSVSGTGLSEEEYWSEAEKLYRRFRATIDAAGELDELDLAKIRVDQERATDDTLRHVSDDDRNDPRMRVATKVALLFGEPPPESLEAVRRDDRRFRIERLEEKFARFGNPMDVCEAYTQSP